MYSAMRLSSPSRHLILPGVPRTFNTAVVSAGEYADYLNDYAAGVKIQRGTVTSLQRSAGEFQVAIDGEWCVDGYSAIVVCTGMFNTPYMPRIEGLTTPTISTRPVVTHAAEWPGPASFIGSRMLIVGGGMTAVEIAEECVEAGIQPLISCRRSASLTFPQRVLGVDPRHIIYPLMHALPLTLFRRQCFYGWKHRGIDRGFRTYRQAGKIAIRPYIAAVRNSRIKFSDGTSADVDHVVFATGYRWEMPFLPANIRRGQRGNPIVRRGEPSNYPGLFFVGIPCAFSIGSHFIHGMTRDARRVAEAIRDRYDQI
jgi:putative flavoprotein involved in K+ transport